MTLRSVVNDQAGPASPDADPAYAPPLPDTSVITITTLEAP